jgi:hypothetical protein
VTSSSEPGHPGLPGSTPLPEHASCVIEQNRRINWDRVGMLASLACGIHCLLLPVAMPLLMASGFEFVANPWFEGVMSASIVAIGVHNLFSRSARGLANLVSWGLIIGIALLVAGNLDAFLHGHDHGAGGSHGGGFHAMIPIGALLVALANGLDWWRTRHQGCVHSH